MRLVPGRLRVGAPKGQGELGAQRSDDPCRLQQLVLAPPRLLGCFLGALAPRVRAALRVLALHLQPQQQLRRLDCVGWPPTCSTCAASAAWFFCFCASSDDHSGLFLCVSAGRGRNSSLWQVHEGLCRHRADVIERHVRKCLCSHLCTCTGCIADSEDVRPEQDADIENDMCTDGALLCRCS